MSAFNPGDIVYIVENGNHIRECRIVSIDSDFAVISFGRGGTRLRLSRLYHSREEAEANIPKHEEHGKEHGEPHDRSPWQTPWD